MKNQYFGDVNDYRKYGLLRCLTQASGLSLGVCWLLTEPDGRRDGEFRRYLMEPERWRHFDPDLYDRLRQLLSADVARDVRHAEGWAILAGAEFDIRPVPTTPVARETFFASSLDRLRGREMLFLDPDNGIEVPSRPAGSKHSTKYIYWRELAMAYERGHSLLVYQHFPMHVKRDAFLTRLRAELIQRLRSPQVIVFRTPHVAFFLVPQRAHEAILDSATVETARAWRGQLNAIRLNEVVGPHESHEK